MEQNPNKVEIVLLDDNFGVRYILRTFLQRLGSRRNINIHVHTSADGVQGLGYIFTTKPKIIIVDTTLPQYSGREILEYLATNPNYTSGERKIIVIHDGQIQLKLPEQYIILNKQDRHFLSKILAEVSRIVLPLDKQWPFFIRLWRLGRLTLRLTNVEEALIRNIKSRNILFKLLYPLWLVVQIIISILLSIHEIVLPPVRADSNLQQQQADLTTFRVKHYPTLITALIAVTLIIIQILGYIVGGVAIFHFTGRIEKTQAAFGNGYTYRRSITIDNTKVEGSGDLTNYPVMVSGTYSYLATVANGGNVTNANGYDIIFTSDAAGSTKLDHEIEKYVATTGEIISWVRIPTLDYDNDTVIYMFYANSGVTTTQEAITGTWNSNYGLVAHLNQTSGDQLDSTSNNNDFLSANISVVGKGTATGKIGGANDFEASSSNLMFVDTATNLNFANTMTLSAWVQRESQAGGAFATIMARGTGSSQGYDFNITDTAALEIFDGVEAVDSATGVITDATWYYVTAVVSADQVTFYVNGVVSGTANQAFDLAASIESPTKFTVGVLELYGPTTYADYYDGIIDEVRASNTALTAGWVATDYNNQNSPSTFYSISAAATADAVVTTSALGTQTAGLTATTAQYMGGAFVLINSGSVGDITGITIAEQGTVSAQTGLSNIKLFYELDTVAPYDCASVSYGGSETQFGSTGSFNAANGTAAFTGSVALDVNQAMCVYTVLDVNSSAGHNQTVEIQITDPSTQVIVSNGATSPGTAIAISGASTISNPSTSITLRVNADADSAYDVVGNANVITTTPMQMGGKNAGGSLITGGVRFTNVTVPKGALINSAKLDFVESYGGSYGTNVKSTIYAEAVDSSATFSNASLPRARALTTSNANWDSNGAIVAAGSLYSTSLTAPPPEISSLLQEVVDRSGWNSGNSVSFIIKDNGSTNDWWWEPRAYAFGAAAAPYLYISYTTTSVAVSTSGTQTSDLAASSSNQYIGGKFVLQPSLTNASITGITISEQGTVNAQTNLSNIKLYYELDSTAPYDCASESYGGSETQFGSTGSFNAANGTAVFTGSVAVTTVQGMCVYTVLDIGAGAGAGETIEIEITDPSADVTLTSGTVSPGTPIAISGSSTLGVITYANGYQFRRAITVDHTKIPGASNLTNFPILVSGTYSYLRTVANGGEVENSSGYDIIFTSDLAGNTQLSHEIVKYISTTGEVEIWVKVPSVNHSTATEIYMFYSKSGVSDTQNKTDVWSFLYSGVWHANQDPAGSAPQILDSTSNANNASAYGGLGLGDLVAGMAGIGSGITFNGTSEYLRITDSDSLEPASAITLSGWVNATATATYGSIICRDYRANGTWTSPYVTYCLHASNNSDGKPYFDVTTGSGSRTSIFATSAISNGDWHYLVGTYNGTHLNLYVDGVAAATQVNKTGALDYTAGATSDLAIGCRSVYTVNECFNGVLDELRVSETGRSAEWIEAEYNNISNPSTFYSLSGEETFSGVVTDAIGTQTSFIQLSATNQYVGGTFVLSSASSNSVTSITINETGTVDGQVNLDNIKLYYDLDTSAPYDCASESYVGGESQFGSTDTDGFSAADGSSTFAGTLSLNAVQTACVYVVLDALSSTPTGSTLEIQITNPLTDVIASTDATPATPIVLSGTTTINYGTTVTATGTQAFTRNINTTNQDVGGRFVIASNSGVKDVTGITIREQGTVNASLHLDNIKLVYDLDVVAPYDCESESYGGAESQFGATDTDGFGSADGTVTGTGTVSISPTQSMCVYVVLDIVTGANTGQTMEIQVSQPSSNVTVSSGSVGPSTPENIPGTTTLIGTTTAVTAAVGTQINSMTIGSVNQYVGGTLRITPAATTVITSITIAELGTVNAQTNLNNIKLYYDLDITSPYTCDTETFSGTEAQYGATDTDGFNAASGTSTFTDSSIIVSNVRTMCVYVVLDVLSGATAAQTLEIQITNPSTQVVLQVGTVTPATAIAITGTSTLRAATTAVNLQISAAGNNGYDFEADSVFRTAPPMGVGGQDATMGDITTGLRFLGVTIPRAATILTAKLDFQEGLGVDYGTGVSNKIFAEDADSSAVFSLALPRDRVKTTESVDWDSNGSMGAVGTWYSTVLTAPPPEMNNVVQEVVDRSGWVSGNPMTFIVANDGSAPGYAFATNNYTTAALSAPKFTATYTTTSLLTTAIGLQTTSLYRGAVNQHIGGAFVIQPRDAKALLTGITIAELGTVDGLNNLDNIKLYYDIDNTAPYDCVGETYDGTETQFGVTDTTGFSAANGTSAFTGSVDLSLTQAMCVYTVLDILVGATNAQTIEIQITTPSSQVTVSSGVSASYGAAAILGTTSIMVNATPSVTSVLLNGGSSISLTEGTTTPITVTATVTDTNGYATISHAIGRVYRSGVSNGFLCTTSGNDCYQSSSATLTGCAGNSCTATFVFDVQYFADPTDVGSPFAAESWTAGVQAFDTGGAENFAGAGGTELNSLIAVNVVGAISYGSLLPGDNSGSTNGTIVLENTGNRAADTEISGTDLCSDFPTCAAGVIPVANQEYAASPFTYGAGTDLSTSATLLNIALAKRTLLTNPSQTIYWGISLPGVLTEGNYTGNNSIIAIPD